METLIHVLPKRQKMLLLFGDQIISDYDISTAANGLGELKNSYCTPRGWHYIRAKIGLGLPYDSVLVGRRWTNEIFDDVLYQSEPNRDWILTRILWLSGLEPGSNRLGNVDTMQRYVYIHGSPTQRMDKRPMTRGCIGMYSEDILDLFDKVNFGCRVFIGDNLYKLR